MYFGPQFQRRAGLTALVALAACKPKPAPPVAPAPITIPSVSPAPDSAALERERLQREAADRAEFARRRALDSANAAAARDRAVLGEPIHFELDRFELTGESRDRLAAKLEILVRRPSLRIRIEGHADERGSSEYNLALGTSRAAAAKRFLTQRDIAPERIETTSFGEERPVCSQPAESCWQLNRRGEFIIVAE